MEKMAADLKIDTSEEQTPILNDSNTTSLQTWQAYFLYLEYMTDYFFRVQKLQKLAKDDPKEKQRRYDSFELNRAFLYKLMFLKAKSAVNLLFRKKHCAACFPKKLLKNIWDHMNWDSPVAPFASYFQAANEMEDRIWRTFEINEKQDRSKFLNMEKIKLAHAVVQDSLNIPMLKKHHYVQGYFPLHDPYQLCGKGKYISFLKLKKIGLMEPVSFTETEVRIKSL